MRYILATAVLLGTVFFTGVQQVKALPTDDLIASYPFNNNADDESGNNNHGTINSAAPTTDRCNNPNSAFSFGTLPGINIPTTILSSNAGTISLWFENTVAITETTEAPPEEWLGLINVRDSTDENPRLDLTVGYVSSIIDGEIFGVKGRQSPDFPRSAVAASTIGSIDPGWHHLVLVSDNAGHSYFLDGVQYVPTIFYGSYSASTNLWPVNGTNEALIGSAGTNLDLKIDDVNIYSRALSNAEVQELFTETCSSPITLSCTGFEPPMANGPVTVKKNRALPLKAELSDADSFTITDTDITALPVVQVLYDSGIGGDPEDVTNDALNAGAGTEGNQFSFNEDGTLQFNLKTKNYDAPGTYEISMVSGDAAEYIIDPTCTASFVIE